MTLDHVVDLEEIRQLKYRYARLLDTKDWDALAGLFVPDATASYSGGQLSFDGRDAIMGFLRQTLGSASILTSHVMTQPEVELTGPDEARGTWALADVVILTEPAPGMTVRGASFYSDRYVRTPAGWRFAHTGYRRVWEEVAPRSPDAHLTASWFSNEGRSSLVGP